MNESAPDELLSFVRELLISDQARFSLVEGEADSNSTEVSLSN